MLPDDRADRGVVVILWYLGRRLDGSAYWVRAAEISDRQMFDRRNWRL